MMAEVRKQIKPTGSKVEKKGREKPGVLGLNQKPTKPPGMAKPVDKKAPKGAKPGTQGQQRDKKPPPKSDVKTRMGQTGAGKSDKTTERTAHGAAGTLDSDKTVDKSEKIEGLQVSDGSGKSVNDSKSDAEKPGPIRTAGDTEKDSVNDSTKQPGPMRKDSDIAEDNLNNNADKSVEKPVPVRKDSDTGQKDLGKTSKPMEKPAPVRKDSDTSTNIANSNADKPVEKPGPIRKDSDTGHKKDSDTGQTYLSKTDKPVEKPGPVRKDSDTGKNTVNSNAEKPVERPGPVRKDSDTGKNNLSSTVEKPAERPPGPVRKDSDTGDNNLNSNADKPGPVRKDSGTGKKDFGKTDKPVEKPGPVRKDSDTGKNNLNSNTVKPAAVRKDSDMSKGESSHGKSADPSDAKDQTAGKVPAVPATTNKKKYVPVDKGGSSGPGKPGTQGKITPRTEKAGSVVQKGVHGNPKAGQKTPPMTTPRGQTQKKIPPVTSTQNTVKAAPNEASAAKPAQTSKGPLNASVSSELSAVETTQRDIIDERQDSRISVTSSKVSDTSLKFDVSSSSTGLPSSRASTTGLASDESSTTGSVRLPDEPSCTKIHIDVTGASDSEGNASKADLRDVEKDQNYPKGHASANSGRQGEVGKIDSGVKCIKIVRSNVQSESKTDHSGNGTDIAIEGKAKSAETGIKPELAHAGAAVVPAVSKEQKKDAVKSEGKDSKGVKPKEVKIAKDVKEIPKEGKDSKVKDSKVKNAKKDHELPKEKEVKVSKVEERVESKQEGAKEKPGPAKEAKEPEAKKGKGWKGFFSRDSKSGTKSDKGKKKDQKKGGKKDSGNKPSQGKSAWSRINTRELLSVGHAMAIEEALQNGTAEGPKTELGRKESMSVLTVPNSAEDKQGKPDAKSLRSTGSRLSVTSARRGSMESRRSVDIRGGLLNATVVNPPGTEEKQKSLVATDGSYIRTAIPVLPLPMAIACLIINILIPGIGTVLSGFSIFCCGKPRVDSKSGDQKIITFCVNVWVGLAQLFTVTFCLVGWAWSIGWGALMVGYSLQHRQEMKERREKELQTMALSAFAGSPVRRMMGFST